VQTHTIEQGDPVLGLKRHPKVRDLEGLIGVRTDAHTPEGHKRLVVRGKVGCFGGLL
jgi:hypothetical protein